MELIERKIAHAMERIAKKRVVQRFL